MTTITVTIGVLFLIAAASSFRSWLLREEQYVFTGSVSQEFGYAANWSTRRVPGFRETVFLLGSNNCTVSNPTEVHNFYACNYTGTIRLKSDLVVSGHFSFGHKCYASGDGTLILTSFSGSQKEVDEADEPHYVELYYGYNMGGKRTMDFDSRNEAFTYISENIGRLKHDRDDEYMIYTDRSTMIPTRIIKGRSQNYDR